MKNKLMSQLNNPLITREQHKLLLAGLKTTGGVSRGWTVLVVFIVLVLVGHYTGFEQWVRALMEVAQ
jgi:hypothetical protein